MAEVTRDNNYNPRTMSSSATAQSSSCNRPPLLLQHSGENEKYLWSVKQHNTLRQVLNDLGPQSLKIAPRSRGTAKTELDFIEAAAPEFLDRPALAVPAPAPAGEILVLVQCTQPDKWSIYGTFVTLPF